VFEYLLSTGLIEKLSGGEYGTIIKKKNKYTLHDIKTQLKTVSSS
jgi:hypothetical protein